MSARRWAHTSGNVLSVAGRKTQEVDTAQQHQRDYYLDESSDAVGGIDSITLIGAVDRTSSNSSKPRKKKLKPRKLPVTRKANASRQPAKAVTTKGADTQYYSRKKLDSHERRDSFAELTQNFLDHDEDGSLAQVMTAQSSISTRGVAIYADNQLWNSEGAGAEGKAKAKQQVYPSPPLTPPSHP
jgi:hypothetical protein